MQRPYCTTIQTTRWQHTTSGRRPGLLSSPSSASSPSLVCWHHAASDLSLPTAGTSSQSLETQLLFLCLILFTALHITRVIAVYCLSQQQSYWFFFSLLITAVGKTGTFPRYSSLRIDTVTKPIIKVLQINLNTLRQKPEENCILAFVSSLNIVYCLYDTIEGKVDIVWSRWAFFRPFSGLVQFTSYNK